MPYHTLSPQFSLIFWSSQTIPLQKGLKDRVHDHTVPPELRKGKAKKPLWKDFSRPALSRHTGIGVLIAYRHLNQPCPQPITDLRCPTALLHRNTGAILTLSLHSDTLPISFFPVSQHTSKSHENISYPSNS